MHYASHRSWANRWASIFARCVSPSDKDADGSWYTIDGRALNAQPTLRGLYINNGRKVMVK